MMGRPETPRRVSKRNPIHPFGQIYWPFPVKNHGASETLSNNDKNLSTDHIIELTNTNFSSHDSCRKKSVVILCERCDERPALISCNMCCSNRLCMKCSHHLHSYPKRKFHQPTFSIEMNNDSESKEETSFENRTLKDICEDTLSSMKMIVDMKKTAESKTTELQKLREEKRIQKIIRENEEKELRAKELIRNTSENERNKAVTINRFARLSVEKIRFKKREESLHNFIDLLLSRENTSKDYFAVIIQKHFRRFSVRNYFFTIIPCMNYQEEITKCIFARVDKDFTNRRKQERANLLLSYQKTLSTLQEAVSFQLSMLQQYRNRCDALLQIVGMEIEVKEKLVRRIDESMIHCKGDQVSDNLHKSIKCELARLHHLERKQKKHRRQIDVIDVQLTCIRGLEKNMVALVEKHQTQLQELSTRWITIQSLLDFVNSKLNSSVTNETTNNYKDWLEDQKQKMIHCLSEYDVAQEYILYRQLDGVQSILDHSVQSYELVLLLVDSLRLEIGWESERIGLELEIFSNEDKLDYTHSCVDRIKDLRERAKILRDESSDAYAKMDSNQEYLNNFNFQMMYNSTPESTIEGKNFNSLPQISKDKWICFFNAKPWIKKSKVYVKAAY